MSERQRLRCSECGREVESPREAQGGSVRCECGGRLEPAAAPLSGEEVARKWYYSREGRRYGPVPLGMLNRLLEEGRIGPDDLVWSRGLEGWKPLREVEQIGRELPGVPAENHLRERGKGEVPGERAPKEEPAQALPQHVEERAGEDLTRQPDGIEPPGPAVYPLPLRMLRLMMQGMGLLLTLGVPIFIVFGARWRWWHGWKVFLLPVACLAGGLLCLWLGRLLRAGEEAARAEPGES